LHVANTTPQRRGIIKVNFDLPTCEPHPLERDLNKLLFELLSEPISKHPVRPSALMHCARQLYFQYRNWKNPGEIPATPMGVRKLMTFKRGHETEKLVGSWLAQLPGYKVLEYKKQIPIDTIKKEEFGGKEDFHLTGEIDRFLVAPDGTRSILDVKSMAERTFLRIYETRKPHEGHYFQQQCYLHGMRAAVHQAMLYCENKNTQAYTTLTFPYDERAWTTARGRIVYLLSLMEKETPPPREYIFGEWQCDPRYCDFHDYCYAWLKTRPPQPIGAHFGEYSEKILTGKKLTADESGQLIKQLQYYGDGGVFHLGPRTLTIKKLKTKLSLDIS
jgi:hypothetical protein